MAWTEQEVKTIFVMRDAGVKWDIVAQTLGRSKSAVKSYYRDRLNREENYRGRARRNGSEKLRDAINQSIELLASQRRISFEEALADMLGPEPTARIPGTERIYKTASIERLAA